MRQVLVAYFPHLPMHTKITLLILWSSHSLFIIHYSLLQLLRYIARSCNIVDVIFLSFIAHAESISRAKSDATTIQQIHQIVTNKHLKILQNQTNPKTCCSMKLI